MKKKYIILISKTASILLGILTIIAVYSFMKGALGLYTGCDATSYTEVLFKSDTPKKLKINEFDNPVKFHYTYWIDDYNQVSYDRIVLLITQIIEGYMYDIELENYSLMVNTDYNVNDYFEWDGYFNLPETRFIERGTIFLKIGFKTPSGDWWTWGGDKTKISIWTDDDIPPLENQPQISITNIESSAVFNDNPILKTEVWVHYPDYAPGQYPHFRVYLEVDGDHSNPLYLDSYYGNDIWIPHLEWGGSKEGTISVVANLMTELDNSYGDDVPIIYQSEEKTVSCQPVPDPYVIEVEYDYQEGYPITKLEGSVQDNAFAAAGIKLNFLDPDEVLEEHMIRYDDNNVEMENLISSHKNKGKNAYTCGIYGFGYDTDFNYEADLLVKEVKGRTITGNSSKSGALICLGVESDLDFIVIHEMGHHIGSFGHCLNQCVMYDLGGDKIFNYKFPISEYNFRGNIYLTWNPHFCPDCVSWLKSEKLFF